MHSERLIIEKAKHQLERYNQLDASELNELEVPVRIIDNGRIHYYLVKFQKEPNSTTWSLNDIIL